MYYIINICANIYQYYNITNTRFTHTYYNTHTYKLRHHDTRLLYEVMNVHYVICIESKRACAAPSLSFTCKRRQGYDGVNLPAS